MWAEPTKGNNDYDVYLGPGEYYALIDYSEGVDVKVPISIREYYGAAEPPVRCGESHLSGLTEPPHFVY